MEKIKNLPVMRVAAFAVVVAIILGLSASMLSFTVSAETVDDVVSQLGTLGNYDCIKFKPGQHMTFEFLRDIYHRFNHQYVYGVVLGYKDGKFVSISNASTRLSIKPRSSSDSSLVVSFCSVNMYESEYPGKYDVYYQHFVTNADSGKYGSTCFHSKNGTGGDAGFIVLANSYSEFINQYGDTLYLVYTASNSSWSDKQFVSLQNDIIDNLNDSNYKDIDTGSEPSAEFLSFKGTGSSGLYLIDWITAGQQYPIVDFRIDDKGNYHKYALRISGNSNYAEILKGMWDRQEIKEASSAALNGVGVLLLLKTALSLGTKAVVSIAGASTPIGALFLNVPTKDVAGYVMLAAQNKLVQEYDTLSYDNIRTLSSETMNFSESSTTVSKAVSLCLSDYVSVVPNTLYKLEIIDVTESKLLDVAYFSSRRGYTQSDSGYGTVVSDYDNKNDLDNDIDNNNGYSNGNKNNGDKFSSDNPYDIIKNNNEFYSQLDISNIFGSLQSSASSLGSFFQACMSIIPAGILAVIIGGLSIVIILRILGR